MKRTNFARILSYVIIGVLIAAMALTTVACDSNPMSSDSKTESKTDSVNNSSADSATEIGEGSKTFSFICTFSDGAQKKFTVRTDASTVGEALIDNGLITGDNGPYGMYVKSVCGVTADYDIDGTYWSFYINGEYAMSGAEKTSITDGATYEFKVQK